MTNVLAHAIANRDYQYDTGLVGIPMHCELEDQTMKTLTVWFRQVDLPTVEAYYKSPECFINPLELVV